MRVKTLKLSLLGYPDSQAVYCYVLVQVTEFTTAEVSPHPQMCHFFC